MAENAEAHSVSYSQKHANEKWPGGPTVERKSQSVDLYTYCVWLREVESKFGRNDAISRIRRLYYGSYAGSGSLFDKVINTNNDHPPMTASQVSRATLNGLYSTNDIITPNGTRIDPSHIFAEFDLTISDTTDEAETVNDLFENISFNGLVTWVGDLASWFVEWNAQRKAQHKDIDPFSIVRAKAGRDDILGDIDAQVMTQQFLPHARESLFKMFLTMYGGETAHSPKPLPVTSSTRFQFFVAKAKPAIPHKIVDRSPLRVELDHGAYDSIHSEIRKCARTLIAVSYFGGGYGGGTLPDVDDKDYVVREIAHHFVKFLRSGLEGNNPPWP